MLLDLLDVLPPEGRLVHAVSLDPEFAAKSGGVIWNKIGASQDRWLNRLIKMEPKVTSQLFEIDTLVEMMIHQEASADWSNASVRLCRFSSTSQVLLNNLHLINFCDQSSSINLHFDRSVYNQLFVSSILLEIIRHAEPCWADHTIAQSHIIAMHYEGAGLMLDGLMHQTQTD